MDTEPTDVRVVYGQPGEFVAKPQRSPAQKHADTALENAETAAEQAFDALVESLEWLSVVKPPSAPNVTTYVRQLIDEIKETRRIRQ